MTNEKHKSIQSIKTYTNITTNSVRHARPSVLGVGGPIMMQLSAHPPR